LTSNGTPNYLGRARRGEDSLAALEEPTEDLSLIVAGAAGPAGRVD
jgi:hypothetical protein